MPAPDAAPADAGCTPEVNVTIAPLAGVPPGALVFGVENGGFVAAWRDAAGIVVQRFDDRGTASGAPINITGDGVWGVAANVSAVAALVSRGDVLALAVAANDGTAMGDQTLMGGVPHDVVNNEWFGNQLRAARLDWNGTQWVAYSTVQRLWPDMIAHYGDTLRTFAPDGAPADVYWGWGCSHSMEVRLAHNNAGIGAICSSDCFPEKGLFFLHQTTLFLDPSGNCRGVQDLKLGDTVANADGYFASFVSREGRTSKDAAIIFVSNDRRPGEVRWLTDNAEDELSVRLAKYGAGFVAVYWGNTSAGLQLLDASGAPIGAPTAIDRQNLEGASDFFTFASGEVGWLSEGRLARIAPLCR